MHLAHGVRVHLAHGVRVCTRVRSLRSQEAPETAAQSLGPRPLSPARPAGPGSPLSSGPAHVAPAACPPRAARARGPDRRQDSRAAHPTTRPARGRREVPARGGGRRDGAHKAGRTPRGEAAPPHARPSARGDPQSGIFCSVCSSRAPRALSEAGPAARVPGARAGHKGGAAASRPRPSPGRPLSRGGGPGRRT